MEQRKLGNQSFAVPVGRRDEDLASVSLNSTASLTGFMINLNAIGKATFTVVSTAAEPTWPRNSPEVCFHPGISREVR